MYSVDGQSGWATFLSVCWVKKKKLFLKIGIWTEFFSGELQHNCGEFVQSEETFTGSTQVEARRGSMSELRHQLRPGFCDSHWHKSVNSPTGASGETVQDSSAVGV